MRMRSLVARVLPLLIVTLPSLAALPGAAFARPVAGAALPQAALAPQPAPEAKPHEAPASRGLYVRGSTAGGPNFPALLDHMGARGIDTIVLDAKDYDGLLTYPSRVPLAVAAGAVKHTPMGDLGATIRIAHERHIRVAVRVSCFEDEHMARARPALSVRSKAGNAYRIGWLDPSNEEAQGYLVDLVREALDAGADEIQLDYVRYPVLGIKNADFHLAERGLTKPIVIRDFVRKVHGVTRARGVPLALDIFGVVAFGKRSDIESLGQDPAMLARECEILAPMVYPSHYAPGFSGFDEPGDHPELVGIATRAIIDQLVEANVVGGAVIRPWLQAMHWKSPTYSPGYLASEIRSAANAGGSGWLMWNPGQNYNYAWIAVPSRTGRMARATSQAPSVRR